MESGGQAKARAGAVKTASDKDTTDMRMAEMISFATALNSERQNKHELDSIFSRSIGVDENCLSPRQIVSALLDGVDDQWRTHVLECLTCMENVNGLAMVNLQVGADWVNRALRIASGVESGTMDSAKARENQPLSAVLAFTDRNISAKEPMVLTCEIIPAFDRQLLARLDFQSLHLEGAIASSTIAVEGPVDVNADGIPDLLRVTITGGKLSRRVRHSVDRHQRVIDTVRMRGHFKDQGTKLFAAQATLTFA